MTLVMQDMMLLGTAGVKGQFLVALNIQGNISTTTIRMSEPTEGVHRLILNMPMMKAVI
jgi:hypothetical protein